MHPNVQSEPPLPQLWTIPTCPITGSTYASLFSLLRELCRAMTFPLSLLLSNRTNPKSLAAQSFHTFASPKLLHNLLPGAGEALGRAGSQHTQTQPRLQVHMQNKPCLVQGGCKTAKLLPVGSIPSVFRCGVSGFHWWGSIKDPFPPLLSLWTWIEEECELKVGSWGEREVAAGG